MKVSPTPQHQELWVLQEQVFNLGEVVESDSPLHAVVDAHLRGDDESLSQALALWGNTRAAIHLLFARAKAADEQLHRLGLTASCPLYAAKAQVEEQREAREQGLRWFAQDHGEVSADAGRGVA